MDNFYQSIINLIRDGSPIIVALMFMGLFGTIIQAFIQITRKGIKLSIKVAVIGQPRAGKTTLITVVFERIMSGKLARHIRVNGTKTVERITNYLSIVRGGKGLGPTEDSDVFAYRYTAVIRRIFLKFQYDVEVADFPGEYSEALTEDQIGREILNSGLIGKEFFSWVLNADRYIFVIDLREVFGQQDELQVPSHGFERHRISREYIERMDVLVKNAVLTLKQELLDQDVYSRPVLLVFSKADCLLRDDFSQDNESTQSKGKKPNLSHKDSAISRDFGGDAILDEFESLINFLRANFDSVDTIFHSSLLSNGEFSEETNELVSFMSP